MGSQWLLGAGLRPRWGSRTPPREVPSPRSPVPLPPHPDVALWLTPALRPAPVHSAPHSPEQSNSHPIVLTLTLDLCRLPPGPASLLPSSVVLQHGPRQRRNLIVQPALVPPGPWGWLVVREGWSHSLCSGFHREHW